jgi:hypothetical protein
MESTTYSKKVLMNKATSNGLMTNYSGGTKTLFVKGKGAEKFVKRWSPDATGHIRNDRGHFIKGGLPVKVAMG